MRGDNSMAQDLGGIYYEVDLETKELIESARIAKKELNGLGESAGVLTKGINSADRSASSAATSFSSLSRVATSLMAILSAQQVKEYADSWVNLNNKLVNSLRPSEQLVDVTQRIFDISQQTRSGIDATATLYGRLERATRSAGTSTDDLAKLVETINKGLTVSGATTEESSSTMIQLSQALASGVLRGEEFNSISENGSRLAVALADSLGVTIGQLRAMAAQGKLTTEVVVNGLMKQSDQIAKEFSNTTMTMSQAFSVATNNITKFVGESSAIKSTYNGASSAIVTVSENLDALSGVIAAAAAVMGSRFVGALTAATAEKLKSAVAARQLAIAEKQSSEASALQAASVLRSAEAAKVRALEEVRLAQMMKNTAISASSLAAAEESLSTARVAAATATGRYNAALAANAAAQNVAAAAASGASIAGGLLRGALSLIGGPAGAAMLAGTAILYFWQRAKEARDEAIKLADGVELLASKMKDMSQVQLSAEIAKLRSSIPELSDAVSESQKEYDKATNKVKDYQREIDNWGTSTKRGRQAQEAMGAALDSQAIAADNLQSAQNRLSRVMSTIGLAQAELSGQLRQGIDLLKRNGQEAGVAAGIMNKLGSAINFAAKAKENFNSSSLMVTRSDDGDELLSNIETQNALLSIADKKERAVAEARQEAAKRGVEAHSNQMRQIEEAAAKRYDLQQADSAGAKASKESTKSVNEAAQSLARQKESLDRLNTGYADGSLELAKYDAVVALGNKATTEQIAKAEQQAAAIWKAEQAVKNLAQAEQGRKFAQQEVASYKAMPDAKTGAVQNPTAEIDLQEQQKLAALAKYQAIDVQNAQIYEDAKTAIQQQAANERRRIAEDEVSMQSQAISSILGSVSQGFDGLASIAAGAAGKSSGAYQAMFALSKGFAVAQAALNLQLAISQAMADPTALTPAQKFANYAAIASSGAALLSSIGSISYSGARKNGGPVSAGEMYRVGEGGMPEIYQASSGKQYMIPGDNGKVISNKDMQGGGGGGAVIHQTVEFHIQTTGGIDDATMAKMSTMMKQVSLNTIRDQQRPRGLLERSR